MTAKVWSGLCLSVVMSCFSGQHEAMSLVISRVSTAWCRHFRTAVSMISSSTRGALSLAASKHQRGADLGVVPKASWAFRSSYRVATRGQAPKKQKPRWRGALCKVSGALRRRNKAGGAIDLAVGVSPEGTITGPNSTSQPPVGKFLPAFLRGQRRGMARQSTVAARDEAPTQRFFRAAPP